MRNLTDDIRIESGAHVASAWAAGTVAAMRTETERHEGVMDGIMSNVDAAMVTMGVTDLRLMHDELDGEMSAHVETPWHGQRTARWDG